MIHSQIIDEMVVAEKTNTYLSKHNVNSYLTNLEIHPDNKELQAILKYFNTSDVYLPLYQDIEFTSGTHIAIKLEMINQEDQKQGIHYRESLYHSHDFFEMVYVYQGSAVTDINGTVVTLQAGDLCLLNLQSVHKLIIPDEKSIIFNLLIRRELIMGNFMDLFKETDFMAFFYTNSLYANTSKSHFEIFHLKDKNVIACLYRIIEEFILKEPYYDMIMVSYMTSLLLHLTRLYQDKLDAKIKSKSAGAPNISEILRFIQENYSHRISLSDLASHFGYTERSMMRFLKQYVHHRFTDIVKEFRLNQACYFLRGSDDSIDDIARKTGFSSRSYFDKVFKSVFRQTPKDYRNRFK
ncbi:AraC family transcriptional regulator [Streptococcus pantholopis]|uniref:HTH araC/xylS-type domain-containing protein n=1 Tax=Streptococcus pantholopis TaxID=1811193 RepID=A0A172Q7R2_9STRE|nr:AraC family transcriptional regulator [Streptococcus pantholopis]AND79496.1 hypothetical protein A0O21_05365 [Streptococcus pantholopis]